MSEPQNGDAKLAELAAIVQAVKDRVRARYPQHAPAAEADHTFPAVHVALADLLPVLHARDAAQARVAAIGSVNPRAGGLVNSLIQLVKRTVARAFGWFVRDQVTFNRESVLAVEAILEALNDHNRALASLAAQVNDQAKSRDAALRSHGDSIKLYLEEQLAARTHELLDTIAARSRELDHKLEMRASSLAAKTDLLSVQLSAQIDARAMEIRMQTEPLGPKLAAAEVALSKQIEARAQDLSQQIDTRVYELGASFQPVLEQLEPLKAEIQELKDIRKHWIEWRAGWEHKLATNEVQFLRSTADLQAAFQYRVNQLDATFQDKVKGQHADYLGALDRANLDIQKRLWADLEKIRGDYERLIHTELRLIRLRAPASAPAAVTVIAEAAPTYKLDMDYSRFAERFRGSEAYVLGNLEFYKPYFHGLEQVLDIGCGRGEFLGVLQELGVGGHGIDLSEESVAQCRAKGLSAETADLFVYLDNKPDAEYDGIFSSQVVEHIDPNRLPEMIRLCGAKLRRGGVLAIETPNPECLAIFATHFYLDPTHTRPVPHPLLAFYMEEAGLGQIEVHKLSPAMDSMPELGDLPENFRKKFFGGLDYAIIARKL